MGWLTPGRLRAVTISLFVVGTLISTVGLSGSTKAPTHEPSSQVSHHVAGR
jgi:hypothetical protein